MTTHSEKPNMDRGASGTQAGSGRKGNHHQQNDKDQDTGTSSGRGGQNTRQREKTRKEQA